MSKIFLLHDPTTIGHHLVYAENFIDWALSRGYTVKFSSVDITGTTLHKKYTSARYKDRVEFIVFDMPGDEVMRFYRENGRRLQVRHIRRLQRRFRPEITFFQYGDYMWPQWNRMADLGETFLTPTYMLLIRGNEAHYIDKETYYSRALKRQLQKESLFEGIMTLDEYQVGSAGGPGHLHFLPDPFMPMQSDGGPLTRHERELMERGEQFLAQTGRKPVILFIGAVVGRKNIHWLLEAAYKNPGYCYVQMGVVYGKRVYNEETARFISHLKREGRYLEIPEFLPNILFYRVLKSLRVKFMPLPYEEHYGSSGIQLMALKFRKPVLVPEHGLMGRRVRDNGLGLTFKNSSKEDFFAKLKIFMTQDPTSYKANIDAFMKGFSKKALYGKLDEVFL